MAASVAADHELLSQVEGCLHPKPCALSRQVLAVRALGYDSFKMMLLHKADDVLSGGLNLDDLNTVVRLDHLAQNPATLGEWQFKQRSAFVHQDVEEEVGQKLSRSGCRRGSRPETQPICSSASGSSPGILDQGRRPLNGFNLD